MTDRDFAELRARIARLEHTVAWLEGHLGVKAPDAPTHGVSPRVLGLVRAGNKIAAIAAYREDTGASLADAKHVVDALE